MKTIFGLSTAAGRAGVAVFRVSGPQCGHVWDALTKRRPLPPPRRATVAQLTDPRSGAVLDSCLALSFPAPNSFSGEDMLELHVHGSRAVQEGVADALLALPDVRMAHAGEFTRRALDNGKMTLTEAEALSDLIHSETAAQRGQALRQLRGDLGRLCGGWRSELITLLARVEAVIDFADDELIEDEVYTAVAPLVRDLHARMSAHLRDNRRGERIREGCRMTIAGPPNSGKSSLYNLLLQRQAAIVTPIAGTTRDVLEAALDIAGHAVHLADTAGLRDTADVIEREGIARGLERYGEADLRLFVVACSEAMSTLEAFIPHATVQPSLIVLNKADLVGPAAQQLCALVVARFGIPAVVVSCVNAALPFAPAAGLLDALAAQLGPARDDTAPPALTRPRHRAHLQAACDRMAEFATAFQVSPELAAEELRGAVREVAAVSGHVTVEDVLDSLFREFCIGK